jgi:hypothetical protein
MQTRYRSADSRNNTTCPVEAHMRPSRHARVFSSLLSACFLIVQAGCGTSDLTGLSLDGLPDALEINVDGDGLAWDGSGPDPTRPPTRDTGDPDAFVDAEGSGVDADESDAPVEADGTFDTGDQDAEDAESDIDTLEDVADDVLADADDADGEEDVSTPLDASADTLVDAATDVATDVRPDVLTDAAQDTATDVATDVATDLRRDVLTDTAQDTATDVATDVRPDVLTDAAQDTATDVATDVRPDVLTDAAQDTATDVLTDVAADTATDVRPDALADAATDAAPDISLDVTSDADAGPLACRTDDACPAGEQWCTDGFCESCDNSGLFCDLACPPGQTFAQRNGCVQCRCVPESTCSITCLIADPVCGRDGVTYTCGAAEAECNGTTVAYQGACVTCRTALDCPALNSRCENGVCQPGIVPPPTCATSADCTGGQVCIRNRCVSPPATCRTNSDCRSGETCTGGFCLPAATTCRATSDCPAGQTCLGGVCTSTVVCPGILAPVCGRDGVTYGNPCLAQVAGATVVNNGECRFCSRTASCRTGETCTTERGDCLRDPSCSTCSACAGVCAARF